MTSTHRRIHQAAIRLFSERGVSQVSVAELAEAAGLSQGVVHSHVDDITALFSEVMAQMAEELQIRMETSFGDVADPAARLALGIRWHVRMAHDDPAWGRFVCHFAFSAPVLSVLWSGPMVRDVFEGVEGRRYALRESEVLSAVVFVGSSALGAMHLVREGLADWQDAGSRCAEMALRGLGLSHDDARSLARMELPRLLPVSV